MSEVKIFAMPDPTVPELHGDGLDTKRADMQANHSSYGYEYISDFQSINNLIQRVRAILVAQQGCLRLLEIDAHGNPLLCDGLGVADATHFGAQLKTLNLCDLVEVYLNGCNTGVQYHGTPSLAQQVSQSGPTQANEHVRCIVYGAVGYLSGSHAQGNARCSVDARTGSGKKKRYWDPYPPSGNQPGSQVGTGAGAYRAFIEGVAQ